MQTHKVYRRYERTIVQKDHNQQILYEGSLTALLYGVLPPSQKSNLWATNEESIYLWAGNAS